MTQRVLDNHPKRFALTNELHARPFAPIGCPGRVVMVSFKQPENAVDRDQVADRAHLTALIDRHGGAHPAPEANHYLGDFGRFRLKWERHTEFVSTALIEEDGSGAFFAGDLADQFPQDWLDAAPGKVVAAAEVEIVRAVDQAAAIALANGPLAREFSRESLVIAGVLDGAGIALADFRIHEGGFSRFALIVFEEVGERRIGRVIQRLLEIENYRVLAMLALPIARQTVLRVNEIDRKLAELIARVAEDDAAPEQAILSELTALSAEIEALSAAKMFRFGAARAYAAILDERIAMLREERIHGRQLFSEFMLRRFRPAMRTCESAERRLNDLATRASRIADLLRTRVDVAVQAQNQELLASMDRRAAMQLRLQETVEGLSVVAISYYAVSLATYLLAPIAKAFGLDKAALTAVVAVPVIGLVWYLIRRMRRRIMARHRSG